MKRSIYILSLLLTGSVILFFACTKEELATQKQNTQTSISPNDMYINKLIKSFKQKVVHHTQNPDIKSGETIAADSALWYLEATINYSHAFPNEYYNEMQPDEISISVPVNNLGSVDLTVLTQKYIDLKSEVTAIYNNSTFENKALVLVDLINASRTEDEINITAQTVIGSKGNNTPPGLVTNGPFEVGDDWWYGYDEGKCDLPVYSSDAAIQLRQEMDIYITAQNVGAFFTNIDLQDIEGGTYRRDNDPNPPDNDFDYYLYSTSNEYGTITDETLCLDWQEMNIYYGYLKYLLYTKVPNAEYPAGFAIEKIVSFEGVQESITFDHYYHKGSFQYGYKIYYSEGEGPESL